jgi:hypothetical protein
LIHACVQTGSLTQYQQTWDSYELLGFVQSSFKKRKLLKDLTGIKRKT